MFLTYERFKRYPHMNPDSNLKREMLRHTLATLSYRAGRTIHDAPPHFADFRVGEETRTPVEILSHIGDLLDWALSIVSGEQRWKNADPLPWDAQVGRFYGAIVRLDDYLASDAPFGGSPERLFQGPIADALTHVGQLAMLRRIAGAPMEGRNYYRADIEIGRIESA